MSSYSPKPSPQSFPGPPRELRLLFLDDDPVRAQIFLADNPEAVWVQTVSECLARLEERWDEVHLDHDLGGEHYVELDREDCGMEVVRWLCLTPRPHLMATRFYIHSHNENAASIMVTQMRIAGYRVRFRPFGMPNSSRRERDFSDERPAEAQGCLGWLLAQLGFPLRTGPG
jgi:hypothetical protein